MPYRWKESVANVSLLLPPSAVGTDVDVPANAHVNYSTMEASRNNQSTVFDSA